MSHARQSLCFLFDTPCRVFSTAACLRQSQLTQKIQFQPVSLAALPERPPPSRETEGAGGPRLLPTLFLLGLVGGAWGHRAPEDWPAGLWRGRPAPCRLCGRWQHRQTLSHRLPPPHVWALATPPQPRFWPSRAWGLCPLPGLRTCGCPLTRLRALPTALEAGRRLPGPFCFTDRRCAPQGQREGARGTLMAGGLDEDTDPICGPHPHEGLTSPDPPRGVRIPAGTFWRLEPADLGLESTKE